MRLEGGNPKEGGRPLAWGASPTLGRRPPRRLHLLGPAPPLGGYIKGGRGGGQRTLAPGASLSLSNTSSSSIELDEALPEYCSSTITTPSCCCWSHLPQPLCRGFVTADVLAKGLSRGAIATG